MNRHQCAHHIVFSALTQALAQAYPDIPAAERHRLAELVCVEAEVATAARRPARNAEAMHAQRRDCA